MGSNDELDAQIAAALQVYLGGGQTERNAQIEYNSQGQAWQWTGEQWTRVPQLDLNPARDPNAPSRSFNVSQSLLDPAQIAIMVGQLDEQIRSNIAQELRQLDLLELERDKFNLLTEQGKRDEAFRQQQAVREEERFLENIQLQRQQLVQQGNLAREQMQATAREGQLSREFQAQEGRLNRALQMAQMAEEARRFNQQERRALAAQIAELASDPGDVVQAAAQELALTEGQGSPFSTAIGQGENFITDESLGPLAMTLEAMDSLNRPAQTGGGGRPVFNAEVSPEQARQNQIAAFQRGAQRLTTSAASGAGIGSVEGGTPLLNLLTQQGILQQGTGLAGQDEFTIAGDAGIDFSQISVDEQGKPVFGGRSLSTNTIPRAEKGGVFNKQIVEVHDDELVIGDNFEVIPKNKIKSAQQGGVFTTPQPESLTRARSFVQEALARAFERLRGTSLESFFPGGTVTPVGVSAPGTPRSVQRLAGGFAAAQSGIPQESFLSEAQSLTPTGVREGQRRRTVFNRR